MADVLVVGGGQAALRAAIEARRQGAKVVVVSKGRVGAGGSSAISDTVHSAILAPEDSPEIFFQDIVRGGRQINDPDLARTLAEECTMRVMELIKDFEIALQFEKEVVTPGHSYPRRCFHRSGRGDAITKRLREYAEAIGVACVERTHIVDLVTDGGWHPPSADAYGALEWKNADAEAFGSGRARGTTEKRVVGALGWSDGEWVWFAAGSTVLATGGIGRIYAYSDNPVDVTGEAIGMAWRHGVRLQDMEFVQFYPYRLVSPINIDLQTKLFAKGAVMRNAQGVRFLEAYPRKELETRDVVCYEMFKQGSVFLDVSQVSQADLAASNPRLYALLQRGYQGKLVMQPVEHYSMGGLSIDPDGRTNVAGLYACGECAGGVHGANRLGGGALTEALVFGARAGCAAAAEAVAVSARLVRERAREIAAAGAWLNVAAMQQMAPVVRKRVQETMWKKAGIVRSVIGLQDAYRTLGEMMEEVRPYPPLLDMLQVARIVAYCARTRTESRGAHRLVDNPEEREEWRGNLVVQGETVAFRPLARTSGGRLAGSMPS